MDYLKIDRLFVSDLDANPKDYALLSLPTKLAPAGPADDILPPMSRPRSRSSDCGTSASTMRRGLLWCSPTYLQST